MPTPSEHQLQKAFFQWCIGWPDKDGNPTKPPALLPNVVCFHVPNGGTRGGGFEGKRLKEIGVVPGIPDLVFFAYQRFYLMEWKAPGGALSSAQKQMHPRLLAAGATALITVDNLADAREWSAQHCLTIPFR